MTFRSGLDSVLLDVPKGRIGLITNAAAVGRDYKQNVDLLLEKGAKIKTIFSAEHGYYATIKDGANVPDEEYRGIHVRSIYNGERREIPKEDLDDVDVLVYDMQDVGSRPYTFLSTLHNTIKGAARLGIELIILDRPNPIGSDIVYGPMIDNDCISFVGTDRFPLRYGMTVGELGLYMNRESKAEVTVEKMSDYSRKLLQPDINYPFVPPSLNLPTFKAIVNFTGIVLHEASRSSVGRGTPYPFEQIGFPGIWDLDLSGIKGAIFRRNMFTPLEDPFLDVRLSGYFIHTVDTKKFNSLEASMLILKHMYSINPKWIDNSRMRGLYGSERYKHFVQGDCSFADMEQEWSDENADYMYQRSHNLLYG